jgi:hypothetical protein
MVIDIVEDCVVVVSTGQDKVQNPALALEKRKVWGKNKPGFCLGPGSGSGVSSNESTG